MSTESEIREWRYGQTQAERLVASILHMEGYEAVDPQHPLGGPDGIKDVVCSKDGLRWVAGAYFPTTQPTFPQVRSKFAGDLEGVSQNGARAFAFFVNQHLTVGERQDLITRAGTSRVEIYHLERMRGILDAPKGCGIRLEYLRIPMTEEEQWSFWSTMNQDVVRRLVENESRRDAQHRSLDEKLNLLLQRTNAIEVAVTQLPSHLPAQQSNRLNFEMPTASLSIATICWLHRVITEGSGLPEAVRGRLRSIQVWVGPAGQGPETAAYTPPAPAGILPRLDALVSSWVREHPQIIAKDKSEIVSALARLHHGFLSIHPFVDANGRVARIILDQAARELLNQSITAEFTADVGAYYAALSAADAGDFAGLQERISAALA